MKFTPAYGVFYRDGFHETGRSFEILPEDAEEMRAHGVIEGETPEAEPEAIPEPAPVKPRPRRKKTTEK